MKHISSHLLVAAFMLLSFNGCFNQSREPKVIVVATAALIMEQLVQIKRFTQEHLQSLITSRKDEYTRAINTIKSYGYLPYIVEPCLEQPTYLDDLSPHICYTRSNMALENKGVNEAVSLLKALKEWSFNDNDMIIKVTGRYCFIDDSFIRCVEENKYADVIVQDFTDAAFTGCFAMKCRLLIEFLKSLDLELMEKEGISIEKMLGHFLNKNSNLKIRRVSRIGMKGKVFNDGVNTTIAEW